jgi:hypothetical protein
MPGRELVRKRDNVASSQRPGYWRYVHIASGPFEIAGAGQECVPVYSSPSLGLFLASTGSAFDLNNAHLSAGGSSFTAFTFAVYSHIIQVSSTFMSIGNGYFYCLSVRSNVAAPAALSASTASVDSSDRVITVTMSEGLSGSSGQTFSVSVDGAPRSVTVGSIMPGDTTLSLSLPAQNAIAANSVVSL